MGGLLTVVRDWRYRQEVLRDLRRQQTIDSERDRFLVKDNLTYALSALERNDRRQATELWTKSLDRYPRETQASPLALKVLLGLRRFEEAEALLRKGQKNAPRDPYFAIGLADIAHAKGEHDVAIERCAALRKQFPGVLQGYVVGAASLMIKDRLEEAEILTQKAITMFPEEVRGYIEHAYVATRRQDWQEALQRWQHVLNQFGHQSGYTCSAQAMIQLERYDEADAILSAALVRFPTETGPGAELARSAQARGDSPEAIKRWKRLVQRFPLHMLSCLWAAEALEILGEAAEAERILCEGVDHFPSDLPPIIHLGMLLLRHRQFQAAVEVYATMRQRFPENETGYIRGAEALRQADRADDAAILTEEHRRRFKAG